MKTRLQVSLVGIVVVTAILLGLSIWRGNSPLLGLDLQGGVEVVLQPSDDQSFDTDDIETSVEIIRRRVDALGVAEPDITRQGNNVVVQLPGVDDQQRAIDLVGQTAELTFRPVLMSPMVLYSSENADYLAQAQLGCSWLDNDPATPPLTGDESVDNPDGTDGEDEGAPADEPETEPEPETEAEPAAETPEEAPDDEAPDEAPDDEPPDEPLDEPQGLSADNPTIQATLDPEGNLTTDGSGPQINFDPEAINSLFEYDGAGVRLCDLLDGEIDDPREVGSDEIAVFAGRDGIYLLAPTELTGAAIQSSSADLVGIATWIVSLTLKEGEEGIDKFNSLAGACFNREARCPTQQLAIVLDGYVESAPAVQPGEEFFSPFARDQIQISGGFTEREARDLNLVLRYGSLPVEFDDPAESGLVRTVSATLGRDSLRAGIIAGIVGLALVAAYMLMYYRLLGALALLSLGLSGTMLWVVVSYLSESRGLALTLAGITGLIVSLGVSLDSNVVYFEHLKEGVTSGRTVISSVNQAFPVAFKTIFWANLATLIGAAILWWLTIGSVKGFAAMLAIASILDLVATYFFLRPSVRLLADVQLVRNNPKLLGMPYADDSGGDALAELNGAGVQEPDEDTVLIPELVEEEAGATR